MASAISRAREAALSAGGEYLNNEDLIVNQRVFVIVDLREDEGGFGPCWRVSVEPFFDEDEDPTGILTLPENPARRKFMITIQKELDELEKKGEDTFIGPCTLVKLKGKKSRYMEIVDWDLETGQPILPPGATLAGKVEEEVRTRRPRSQNGQAAEPEPEPEAKRPFVEAVEAKAEPSPAVVPAAAEPKPASRRRVKSDSGSNAHPSPTTTGDFPPIKIWAKAHGYEIPEGRGRVKNEIKQEYEQAKADAALYGEDVAPIVKLDPSPDAPTSQRRRAASRGVNQMMETDASDEAAEPVATRPAQVGAGAPRRAVNLAAGEAPAAQEMTFRPGMQGRSLAPCEACGQHIQDRIFPTGVPGNYALIHTGCTAGGEQSVMEAEPIAEE